MPFSKTALLIFSTLAALSSALPGSHRSEIDLPISPRDETTIHPVTCYGRSYTPAELSAAVAEGCRQEQKNKNRRRSGYPHWYKNREGIAFQVQASKYMEYPILYSGEIYPGYGKLCSTIASREKRLLKSMQVFLGPTALCLFQNRASMLGLWPMTVLRRITPIGL